MTDRPVAPPDDLESSLNRLSSSIDWPRSSDLSHAVHARIVDQQSRSRLFWLAGRPYRLAAVVACVIVLLTVTLLADSGVRTTVADRLGLPGIAITSDGDLVAERAGIELGRATDLDRTLDSLDYEVVGPPLHLGDPDGVYLLERAFGAQISYVYLMSEALPEVGDTGIGALISQFPGNTNESFIGKQLEPGTTIEMVQVGDAAGFWIAGEPHVFYYEDPTGGIQEESIRLATNVLIWERNGVTLRIESNLPKDTAVAIAESMRPPR